MPTQELAEGVEDAGEGSTTQQPYIQGDTNKGLWEKSILIYCANFARPLLSCCVHCGEERGTG